MNSIAKTSYIILGGSMMLSSCAQVDTPVAHLDGSDRRIAVHVSLPELTTKAKEIAKDFDSFNMTAFNVSDDKYIDNEGNKLKEYFLDKKMGKASGSGQYKSDECMWPEQGRESDTLHFFAYYPILSESSKLVNATDINAENDHTATCYKVEAFNVAKDIRDQVDFVTAFASGSMDDNYFSGINLKFRHQLSRIEIKAKGNHKSCDIEIAGVRIANANMTGTFEFQKSDADGTWTDLTKGVAEYIFCEGDTIVTVGSNPVSIIGPITDAEQDNSAMLIPASYSAWDYAGDASHDSKGLYLNVLLRITDKTPTTGKGRVQYPYYDTSQGLNAMNIPREYFAVDTVTNKISKRVYKNDNGYWSDVAFTQPYTLETGEKFREFGWAAMPIKGEWEPGYSYTYTLDYSGGVGIHGPDVTGDVSPKAGDPIISDRVGVSVSVNDWQGLNGSTTHTVDVPGS